MHDTGFGAWRESSRHACSTESGQWAILACSRAAVCNVSLRGLLQDSPTHNRSMSGMHRTRSQSLLQSPLQPALQKTHPLNSVLYQLSSRSIMMTTARAAVLLGLHSERASYREVGRQEGAPD